MPAAVEEVQAEESEEDQGKNMRMTEEEYEKFLTNRRNGTPCAPPSANMPKRDNPLIHQGGFIPLPEPSLPKREGGRKGRQPNKTEQAAYHYLKMCYPGSEPRYEAITFHLQARVAYTPDYFIDHNGAMLCVEIKNAAYKHASYGRSRLAFRQAALEFPQFTFIWLELHGTEWVLN